MGLKAGLKAPEIGRAERDMYLSRDMLKAL